MADCETSLTAFVGVDIQARLSRLRRRPSIQHLILQDFSMPNKLRPTRFLRSQP
jgi:hypothetical protein